MPWPVIVGAGMLLVFVVVLSLLLVHRQPPPPPYKRERDPSWGGPDQEVR